MAIFGTLQTLERQADNARFGRVFDFLRNADLAGIFAEVSPERKKVVEIDGEDVYAIFQEYDTKPQDGAKPEGHRKYADVQYVYDGAECIGYADIADIAGEADYDEASDIYFVPARKLSMVRLSRGEMAILTPDDLHAPCLSAEGEPRRVRKIVFKVKL